MNAARRLEPVAILLLAVVVTGVPLAARGWPGPWVGQVSLLLGTSCLAAWRQWPRTVAVLSPALLMVSAVTGPDPPAATLVFLLASFALVADTFEGRLAWVAGLGCGAYLLVLYVLTDESGPGLAMLTVPGYVAGTALRLRRRTADDLAERSRELEEERELFADMSVRTERARIAAELHDIVGHALSVMVVQAAAGQRLVDAAPGAARSSLEAIAESARQGRADLTRLIDLLGGSEVGSYDLALVDELVARAARSGLHVTCRLEGERDGVSAERSHAAYRVVQESLTNALRHAPGAGVRVLVRGSEGGRALLVRVENDASPSTAAPSTTGSGRGLQGLRERVSAVGGTLTAGPAAGGGWVVEARL